MADVTDAAFREIIAERGKPDVMWTEFVSADGLARAPEEGRRKLLLDLKYSEKERPIIAQFFTSHPENMKSTAALAESLGFDGIDINMGCPDKNVNKQKAGAELIKNPALAREIIRAAKDGAPNLPISVKTRVGYNTPELETWLRELLKEEPAVVTVHARTRKEMSKVPARWEFVKRAVEIRDELNSNTLIFGNGDVMSMAEAREKVLETGCDGVMLGRAIFGNPWLFAERTPSVEERLETLVEHCELFEKYLGGVKNFAVMKKHFKSYVSAIDGASGLRGALMNTSNASEVREIIQHFLKEKEIAGV